MNGQRHIQKWAYGCYAWVVFGTILLLTGALAMLMRKPRRARPVVRMAALILFRLTRMPVTVHGLEQLPTGPHILLVNHTSFLDPIVLTACLPARPGYAFVVRQQYRSQALLWPLLKPLGTVVLRPSAGSGRPSENIALLAAALRRGDSLVLFPEGGFTPASGLKHFHTGAFVAAATESVPIAVAGLRGARTALRLGRWLPRRVPIRLEIGEVLVPEEKDPHALAQLCRTAYEAMLPLTGEGKADD